MQVVAPNGMQWRVGWWHLWWQDLSSTDILHKKTNT
jgi:hypothetical protein